MGCVIYPDGTSRQTSRLKNTITYNDLVEIIKSDKFTVSYRSKCIMCLGDLGIPNKDVIPYLEFLSNSNDKDEIVLKNAASYTLSLQNNESMPIPL